MRIFFPCFFISIIKNKKGKNIYSKVRKAEKIKNFKMKVMLILAPLHDGHGPG